MILHFTWLILTLPIVLSFDKTNFRNRRMLLLQPHQRKNVPFVIRVPYSKVVSNNPIFSHSAAWKAKQPQLKSDDEKLSEQQQSDVEITQFHSQDTNGQVVFGFNSPDQMRIETRNSDGTVHGTYSYLDPYGQIIKRQYWDTGAGFHVTSNTYPVNNAASDTQQVAESGVQYTPEVQAARDLHFQLYQQALASLLPSNGIEDSVRENNTIETESVTQENALSTESAKEINTTKHVISDRIENELNSRNDDSDNSLEPNAQNGSIVIQNPEYLRISWTTENKKYRLNWYNGTDNSTNNSTNKVHVFHDTPNVYNITKFTIQGSK